MKCEYGDTEKCTLNCENGGICAFGIKENVGHGNLVVPWANETHDRRGMHCICPDGYTGLRCQIAAERCGDHLWCFQGSECLSSYDKAKGGMRRYCDCKAADTEDEKFAGKGCQHSTGNVGGAFCTPDLNMDENLPFCVNGGTCFENQDG